MSDLMNVYHQYGVEEEQDYYLECGCWSGQADHTCQDRTPCCGADYDCTCE